MKSIKEIIAESQDYAPDVLKTTDVNTFLTKLVPQVTDVETINLDDGLGRILAQEELSPICVPPHDNSAMDGYAFSGVQISSTDPLTLQVIGVALAGKPWSGDVFQGQCVKIMTGQSCREV